MKTINRDSTVAKILERLLLPPEKVSKELVFDCRMCGQCILHETGLTCPMRCPKNERNGPCGGVRPNGNCEVFPDKPCVWVQGVERAQHLPLWREHIYELHPPVNWRLQNTSSWVNLLTGADQVHPTGWDAADTAEEKPVSDSRAADDRPNDAGSGSK